VKITVFNSSFFYSIELITFIFFFSIQIQTNISNISTSIILFANAQNEPDVDPDCMMRGSVENPPPFLVLRWVLNGDCDSTIDYFIPFYDVKAVVPFQGDFLLFLET
jgi:hypothetical protein